MEYSYATLLLNEADREINERNLTDVLEAADVNVIESRVKAIVAAMEGVDLDETIDTPDAQRAAASATPVEDGSESDAPEETDPATGDDEPTDDAETVGGATVETSDPADDEPAVGEFFGATVEEEDEGS